MYCPRNTCEDPRCPLCGQRGRQEKDRTTPADHWLDMELHAREKPSLGATQMPTFSFQPSDLYPTVQLLFKNYGRAECAKTDRLLFDDQAWDQARRILNAINAGEVSDPPGISLYFEIGVDQHLMQLVLHHICQSFEQVNRTQKVMDHNLGATFHSTFRGAYR